MPHTLQRLWPYVAKRRSTIVGGLICTLGATAIQLAGPWVLRCAIDDLGLHITRARLLLYAVLTVTIAVIAGILRFLMRRLLVGASRDIEYNIRNDFFARLQFLSLECHQARRTGDLMSRASNDVAAVRMMIGPVVMYIITTGLLFLVAIGLMVSIDARLTVIALLPLPLVSIAIRYFGAAIQGTFERIQAQLSDLTAVVQESLAGVRVVRGYGREEAEIKRFRLANDEYVDRNRALIRLQGLFYPSLGLLVGLGGVIVLWLGSRDVIVGRITIGEFVAFNAYLVMLSSPMIAFGWVTNLLERGIASWKRIIEVLDDPSFIDNRPANLLNVRGPSLSSSIEFRDLTFAFGERYVLEHVSLFIRAGQTVAIVGSTGSGKSTLVNLIPRLYEPPLGSIFVGGVDVRTLPLSVLRGVVGMVPQEAFLFSDTVARNIAFGVPHLDGSDHIFQAAAIARLDKDIEAFPNVWDTLVGERGLTLSGGQKQRIAIARALAINPSILVLDDALSAVDACTEDEIVRGVRRLMQKRTCIIISHRVSTIRYADLIVVLQRGRVVEQGTHDELIAAGGLYSEIYRRQLLKEDLAAT